MEQHADLSATCTKSGYNPLLEDFANTSFYLGHTGQCVLVTYIQSILLETGLLLFLRSLSAHYCSVLCRAKIDFNGPTHNPCIFFVLKRHLDSSQDMPSFILSEHLLRGCKDSAHDLSTH